VKKRDTLILLTFITMLAINLFHENDKWELIVLLTAITIALVIWIIAKLYKDKELE
jgi:hypothetical protein